jgi:hypothetical protein
VSERRQDGNLGPPFAPANTVAVKSGFWARSEITRNPRTRQIADWIADSLPVRTPGDELPVWLLSCEIERYLRATAALESGERSIAETKILRRDLSTVANTIGRLAAQCGLSALAAAQLGVDVAHAEQLVGERLRQTAGAGERAEARIESGDE